MEQKTLFEQLGGTYAQQDDYLLPDVKLPEQEDYEIGIWGQRRRQFLKAHHRVKYYNMLTKCELCPHLVAINAQAVRMEETLVNQLAAQEAVTKQLKTMDMTAWTKKMNSIHNRVREIIMTELICV